MEKGQRVRTPLGPATILGFETFNLDGMKSTVIDTDLYPDSRVLVQLDEPKKYMWWKTTQPNPYMYRSELFTLKE